MGKGRFIAKLQKLGSGKYWEGLSISSKETIEWRQFMIWNADKIAILGRGILVNVTLLHRRRRNLE